MRAQLALAAALLLAAVCTAGGDTTSDALSRLVAACPPQQQQQQPPPQRQPSQKRAARRALADQAAQPCQPAAGRSLNSSAVALACPAKALSSMLSDAWHPAAQEAFGLQACSLWPVLESRTLWLVGGPQVHALSSCCCREGGLPASRRSRQAVAPACHHLPARGPPRGR